MNLWDLTQQAEKEAEGDYWGKKWGEPDFSVVEISGSEGLYSGMQNLFSSSMSASGYCRFSSIFQQIWLSTKLISLKL